jgi:hypothetical protein
MTAHTAQGCRPARLVPGALDDVSLVAVPGPMAGAGLPNLILATGGLVAWWRLRRRTA